MRENLNTGCAIDFRQVLGPFHGRLAQDLRFSRQGHLSLSPKASTFVSQRFFAFFRLVFGVVFSAEKGTWSNGQDAPNVSPDDGAFSLESQVRLKQKPCLAGF